MQLLRQVLAAKILLTLSIWCVPLLLFPVSLLEWLGFEVPEPSLFLRLLGMAYIALVVGYAFGWRSAGRGIYPAEVVWVGVVSNGGACALLAVAAATGTWTSWGGFARTIMWVSLFGTGAITVGLMIARSRFAASPGAGG